MVFEAIFLFLGLAVGFFIAWYFISKQKFGDKTEALNERWKRQQAELEKQYELKIEKSKSELEKINEENKTNLEKLGREWQVKYVEDIGELKRLFKESEKIIKEKSVSSSRRTLVGKFIERFVPFLSNVPFSPSDMHFLGQPIDYIVFNGLKDDEIKGVYFLEVKTGASNLSKREKSLREAIEKKKVYWKEIRVDTFGGEVPDGELENQDTAISDLYETIECKLESVRTNARTNLSVDKNLPKQREEERFFTIDCPSCGKNTPLRLGWKDISLLKSGEVMALSCTKCQETIPIDDSFLEDAEEEVQGESSNRKVHISETIPSDGKNYSGLAGWWWKQNFLIKSLSLIASALLLYGFWPWSFVILISLLLMITLPKKKN